MKPDHACYDSEQKKSDPILVVENKKVKRGLIEQAIKEVREQMIVTSAKFGLANNGIQMQLFQRHGKICVPRTPKIATNNASKAGEKVSDDKVKDFLESVEIIKNEIQNPKRALTVMFYNHKGGIGKTTITANVGSLLSMNGEKVLLISFDLQRDLNSLFGFEHKKHKPKMEIYKALKRAGGKQERDNIYKQLILRIRSKKINGELHIMPCDDSMSKLEGGDMLARRSLRLLLEKFFYYEYDYILIDAPPAFSVAEKGFEAADIIVPVIDNPNLGVKAFGRLREFLEKHFEDRFESLLYDNYVINCRFQGKTGESRIHEIEEKIKKMDIDINPWIIPNYVEIERITKERPVVFVKPRGKAAEKFRELTYSIFIEKGK